MIVITGLDGSGKSTLFSKLEAEFKDDISILRVPTIDSELFTSDEALYKQCEFLNHLGERADKENIPSLKIIAMFGSMLLFDRLHDELKKKEKPVFSERHPLIDTQVYAKVYLKVMHPKHLDLNVAKELEEKYQTEINSLIKELETEIKRTNKGLLYDLLNFLYGWFSNEDNKTFKQLKYLFPIKEPRELYFLDAPSEVLMERLGNRETSEYHEAEHFLSMMRQEYLKLFSEIKIPSNIIQTTDFSGVKKLLNIIQHKLQ